MNVMRGLFRKWGGSEEGLSLIELLVVVAILGVLATLTAVAVTGTTSTAKSGAKQADEGTMSDGVGAFSGEHSKGGRYPTFDGCLPGTGLNTTTFTCVTSGDGAYKEFLVDEATLDVDANGDSDKTDDEVQVVALIWNQYFGTGDTQKLFLGDFVKEPKHAFEYRDGTSFSTNTGDRKRPDDPEENNAEILGVPSNDRIESCVGGSSGDCPVWVINTGGEAVALLGGGSY